MMKRWKEKVFREMIRIQEIWISGKRWDELRKHESRGMMTRSKIMESGKWRDDFSTSSCTLTDHFKSWGREKISDNFTTSWRTLWDDVRTSGREKYQIISRHYFVPCEMTSNHEVVENLRHLYEIIVNPVRWYHIERKSMHTERSHQ